MEGFIEALLAQKREQDQRLARAFDALRASPQDLQLPLDELPEAFVGRPPSRIQPWSLRG